SCLNVTNRIILAGDFDITLTPETKQNYTTIFKIKFKMGYLIGDRFSATSNGQNIVITEDYISGKMPNYLQKKLYEYWNIKNTHMSKKKIIPCSPYAGAIDHQVLIVTRLKVYPSRLSLVTAMDYRLARKKKADWIALVSKSTSKKVKDKNTSITLFLFLVNQTDNKKRCQNIVSALFLSGKIKKIVFHLEASIHVCQTVTIG
ncbi:uncharacterized protein EV154DRAFT_488084, partial [Mucor mucedo]|uniref:uncharacterized protein n=1 Tax=Mucor mucedo TaxID=29922 RepID=UPI00221FA775